IALSLEAQLDALLSGLDEPPSVEPERPSEPTTSQADPTPQTSAGYDDLAAALEAEATPAPEITPQLPPAEQPGPALVNADPAQAYPEEAAAPTPPPATNETYDPLAAALASDDLIAPDPASAPPANPDSDDELAAALQADPTPPAPYVPTHQPAAGPEAEAHPSETAEVIEPADPPTQNTGLDELAALLEAEPDVQPPTTEAVAPAMPEALDEPTSPAEAAGLGVIDQQIDEQMARVEASANTTEPEPEPAPQTDPAATPPPAEPEPAVPDAPAKTEPVALEPDPAPLPASTAAPTPASASAEAVDPEDMTLEQEIAALFAEQSVDPAVEAVANQFAQQDQAKSELEQAPAPAEITAQETAAEEPSTEDQIVAEIEDLLGTEAEAQADAADEAEAEATSPGDPTIAEIDQLLAAEAEQDEELVGDFQSVDDVAAGIEPTGPAQKLSDARATETAEGSADAISAELDSQPEDSPDTFTPKPEAEREEPAESRLDLWRARLMGIPWRLIARRTEQTALTLCGIINWPARRLLAPEWRSYVGYIAVLNVFVGLALFTLGVIRQVF
ncbi:MAG: hypothetical protein AAGC44_13870, partial [Planctomycetota bacterium]